MYVSVRLLSYAILRGFYRVTREGGELPEGPLVVVANHTNGLMDAGLLFDMTPRRVRFLAKYTLFKMPVLSWIVRAAAAIPVYRKKDNKPTASNAEAFKEVHRALAAGEIIGVFPEGSSHSEPRLQRLKTGAARLALGAEAENGFGLGVRIVPVAFLYEDRHALRSGVIVRVGQPVPVADLAGRYAEDEWGTVELLNERVTEALRAEMIDVSEDADRGRVVFAEELLPEDGRGRGERLSSLACGSRAVRSARPGLAGHLARRLDTLRERQAAGVPSSRHGVGPGGVVAALLLGLPACLVFGPAWMVSRAIGRAPGLPVDKEPTATGLAAAILLPATVVLVTYLALGRGGGWGWLALPASTLLLLAAPRSVGALLDLRRGTRAAATTEEAHLGRRLARLTGAGSPGA